MISSGHCYFQIIHGCQSRPNHEWSCGGRRGEVAQGEGHGFLNIGTDQLVVESEVIFPSGYDPSLDLMHFAELYDRLKRERPVNSKTGEPPTLQMAVLTHDWRRVIK